MALAFKGILTTLLSDTMVSYFQLSPAKAHGDRRLHADDILIFESFWNLNSSPSIKRNQSLSAILRLIWIRSKSLAILTYTGDAASSTKDTSATSSFFPLKAPRSRQCAAYLYFMQTLTKDSLIDRDLTTTVPRTLLGVALLRLCCGGTFGRLGAEQGQNGWHCNMREDVARKGLEQRR
jgi:hypothetical protein